jgi:hypothetical protein
MDEREHALSAVRLSLIGLPVAHAWRGYGSAIFLEFGALSRPRTRRDGSLGQPCGEWSLGIEWNWRFERPRSILGGAWSNPRRWPGFFRAILGSTVADLRAVGVLPEIEVRFSNGMRLCSFMCDAGQPQWYVIAKRTGQIESWHVERGRIVHTMQDDAPPLRRAQAAGA